MLVLFPLCFLLIPRVCSECLLCFPVPFHRTSCSLDYGCGWTNFQLQGFYSSATVKPHLLLISLSCCGFGPFCLHTMTTLKSHFSLFVKYVIIYKSSPVHLFLSSASFLVMPNISMSPLTTSINPLWPPFPLHWLHPLHHHSSTMPSISFHVSKPPRSSFLFCL